MEIKFLGTIGSSISKYLGVLNSSLNRILGYGSGLSGTMTHGSSVTLIGTGYGTKATAAPLVWDNCGGSDPLTLWDGYWPYASASATYRLDYRTPAGVGRGVSTPHSLISQYLCGSHYQDSDANTGWNVAFWKTLSGWSWPVYYYFSFYYRIDPNWNMTGDTNHKWFGYSSGTDIYGLPYNWYLESYGGPAEFSSHMNDDDSEVGWTSDEWYGGEFPNHPKDYWVKIEIEVRASNTNNGSVKAWADGEPVQLNVNDTTDGTNYGAQGANRSIGVGGYSGTYATDHWRYFADIYFDNTAKRVIIGDESTYSACTVKEVQIPSSWSDTQITFTVNRATFGESATAYLYVVDETGALDSDGIEFTFGQTY
jgi:hypothetical protein